MKEKLRDWIKENNLEHLHDIIYDITNKLPSKEDIAKVLKELPENIKQDIEHWGLSDTCVRDSIYEYLENTQNE